MDPRAARSQERALRAAQVLLVRDGIDSVTHAHVAAESGVGRRTLYRHWPDRRALLHATLSLTKAPPAAEHADLRAGLVAHLTALDDALSRGPLAYILAALHERSVHDPMFDALRDDLVATGCAPLEDVLRGAVQRGELPTTLDVDAAVAQLEGPVVHRALLRRRSTPPRELTGIVDRFLAGAPTVSRRGRRRA